MNPALPQFDPALIARYDVAGPRYTSYPAAPQFHSDFGEAALRTFVQASNDDPIPRALSLYVHVPFCLSPCFYCGCTRVITRDRSKAGVYLERLYREIERVAPLFARDRVVEQLHFGGGTPNFLDAAQMSDLMESLGRHFSFSRAAEREFGIELDPRFCDGDYVRMLAQHGFNRVSVGIQDFDPAVQAAVNRIQSVEQTREILQAARAAGYRSLSVDLIYGLPKQSVAGFSATLDRVIELAPDRIATYAYAHLPERFKAQRQLDAEYLPDAATRLALLATTVDKLTAAGYRYVGMDHFAKADDDLVRAQDSGTLQRNFQGYSTHGDCDLIGLGMSSISHIGRSFSQNARDLISYYAAIDAGRLPIARGLAMSEDDVIRADLIQALMCHGTLRIPEFEQRHALDFRVYFANELERLQTLVADGLVTIEPDRIGITARGRFLLRVIAMCFDAHLARNAMPEVRYSRAL